MVAGDELWQARGRVVENALEAVLAFEERGNALGGRRDAAGSARASVAAGTSAATPKYAACPVARSITLSTCWLWAEGSSKSLCSVLRMDRTGPPSATATTNRTLAATRTRRWCRAARAQSRSIIVRAPPARLSGLPPPTLWATAGSLANLGHHDWRGLGEHYSASFSLRTPRGPRGDALAAGSELGVLAPNSSRRGSRSPRSAANRNFRKSPRWFRAR